MIDQIAAELGVDPLDYRLAHHVTIAGQPGVRQTPPDEIVNDQPVEGGVPFSSNGLRECLLAGAERIGWRERRKPNGSATGPLRRGIGVALGNYKGGGGASSQVEVRLSATGRVRLAMGIVDVGQGSETVMAQIAAETLGVPIERVETVMADTATTPPGHTTAGSTSTLTTGAAVKQACEDIRRQVLARANRTEPFEGDLTSLLSGHEDVVGFGENTSGSKDAIINSFAAHFCEVEVDMQVGRIRVLRYVAAHDSGRIINPKMAQNQVSGGVLQFLGIALREELLIDKRSGVTLNANFLEHKSTTIVDFPPIEVLFPAGPDPLGPYGAKALGEPPVVPVFGAVANAVANATGAWLYEQPFTPTRVLQALREQGRA
jgi:CO/xanthine dehydrogenase Mo-binding subunit